MAMASSGSGRSINLRNRTTTPRDSESHSNFASEPRIQEVEDDEAMSGPSEESAETVLDDTGRSEGDLGRNDHAAEDRASPQDESSTPDTSGFTRTERFRLKEMEAENNLVKEKIRLLELQMAHASHTGHRREHSDDHYRDDRRKKASIPKAPQEQAVVSYESVVIYINDCEDQFDAVPHEFPTDLDKTR